MNYINQLIRLKMIFNNNTFKKIKCFSYLKYIIASCIFTFPKAQDIDTLMYFDENDSLEWVFVLEGNTKIGVRFTPNESWNSFDIKNVDFLVPFPSPYTASLEVYNADSEDGFPGTLYDSFSVLFNDSSVSYPHWYSVDLSHYETMQVLSGDFWITGSANFQTHFSIDTNISGHTFGYWEYLSDCHPTPCWDPRPLRDITIRAMITNRSMAIDNNSINEQFKIEINAYPNPFNANIDIKFDRPLINKGLKTELDIYNINGKRIFSKILSSKTESFQWHGIDSNGNVVGTGIYILAISMNDRIKTKKITIIK